ncbi:MAG: DUF2079 domain-containing protein [Bacteroidetes bacterium]|nr:DUF2079 domain-containing protein [Bacteroidota bacterium]
MKVKFDRLVSIEFSIGVVLLVTAVAISLRGPHRLLVSYLARFTSVDIMANAGLFVAGLQASLFVAGAMSIVLCVLGRRFLEKGKLWLQRPFSTRRALLVLVISVVAYSVFFSLVSLVKYYNLGYHTVDLGIQNQVVWNTSYGRLFINTCSETSNYLGGHVSLDLLLFVPFYMLFRSPIMLLVLQSVALSLAAIPLFFLVKETLSNSKIALTFALLYLLSVPIHGANLFEFHVEVLASLFLLSCFYFMESGKTTWMVMSLILLALVKEDLPVTIIALGIYVMIYRRKPVHGTLISLGATLYTLAVLEIILPYFGHGTLSLGVVYHTLGLDRGIVYAVKNCFLHPATMIHLMFTTRKISYILFQFMFLLFLPLFSRGRVIIVLPAIVMILLSDQTGMASLYTQNICSVTPILFFLAIMGFRELQNHYSDKYPLDVLILISLTALTLIFDFQFDFLKNKEYYTFVKPTRIAQQLVPLLERIPQNASVMATNDLGYLVSGRERFYRVPQYTVPHYDETFRIPSVSSVDYFVYDRTKVDSLFGAQMVELCKSGRMDTLFDKGGIYVFKRIRR